MKAFGLPGISRLDRYLFMEMALPFLFGVAAFTSLVMAIGSLFELIRYMVENGMPLMVAGRIFLLRLPQFVVLTFPMAMLLAPQFAYNRLSADSEITALKACGVSVYRMMVPVVVMSLAVTALTFAFNEQIVPSAAYEASVTLAHALNTEVPSFKKDNIYYQEFEDRKAPDGSTFRQIARILYAQRYNQGVLENLTVLDFTQDQLNQIMTAKRGTWLPKQQKWLFENGTTYGVDTANNYHDILKFDRQEINLSQRPLDLLEKSKRTPEAMTINELRDYIRLLQEAGQDTTALKVSYYQKFALPFTTIAFALVGAMLGLRPQRTTGVLGFGVSILIIFAYYVLLTLTQAWGQLGYLQPMVAAWLPFMITVAIGSGLLWRVSR